MGIKTPTRREALEIAGIGTVAIIANFLSPRSILANSFGSVENKLYDHFLPLVEDNDRFPLIGKGEYSDGKNWVGIDPRSTSIGNVPNPLIYAGHLEGVKGIILGLTRKGELDSINFREDATNIQYRKQPEGVWAKVEGRLSLVDDRLNAQVVGKASRFEGDITSYVEFENALREKYSF